MIDGETQRHTHVEHGYIGSGLHDADRFGDGELWSCGKRYDTDDAGRATCRFKRGFERSIESTQPSTHHTALKPTTRRTSIPTTRRMRLTLTRVLVSRGFSCDSTFSFGNHATAELELPGFRGQ